MDLKKTIKSIKDYPAPGITFRDVTTLLKDEKAYKESVDEMVKISRKYNPDKIVGIEARGFIFGAAVAYELGCGFIPVRKPGKLPRETYKKSYSLEYGENQIEIHKDAFEKDEKVLIIDDLLATGGTSKACAELIKQVGAKVEALIFLIELVELGGRDILEEYKVESLIEFTEDEE